MSICPKCGANLKCEIIESIFMIKFNKSKCGTCNTEIKITKKANKINSIFAGIPIILIVFWGDYIINFITGFTQSNSISQWILICIIGVWGMIIYNGHFPWTEFEEISNHFEW